MVEDVKHEQNVVILRSHLHYEISNSLEMFLVLWPVIRFVMFQCHAT